MQLEGEVTKVIEAGAGADVTCALTDGQYPMGTVTFRVTVAQAKHWNFGRRVKLQVTPR